MKNVNKAFRKKDAMQLVTGKPVYMDDLAPADCLIVKLYRSPHANAMVERISISWRGEDAVWLSSRVKISLQGFLVFQVTKAG